jgi:hypothetical protein
MNNQLLTNKLKNIELLSLPKDDRGFTLDIYNKPIHFANNPNLVSPGCKLPLTATHIEEIVKCSESVSYFIENYVKIFTLDHGFTIPELRSYQYGVLEHYINNRFCNVMMSRQSGKSVTTLLYILWSIIFNPDTIVGIVANKVSLATELLTKIQEYLEQLPIWLQIGIKSWNKTYIILENGSKIYTSSADNGLRGYSCSIIMIDEFAFIDNPENLMNAIMPTLSSGNNTQCITTTTPNGMNYYYHHWMKSENGNSMFKNFKVNWYEVPGRDEEYRLNIINTQGLRTWQAEYACEFMGSSNTLISMDILKLLESQVLQPIIFDKYVKGIKIYENPKEKHKYLLTLDSSKDGIDNSAIHVIDITNFPFKQVLSGKFKISHLNLPEIMNNIGTDYNTAFIIIENNEGGGQSTADTLRGVYEYDNMFKEQKSYYGFRTTTKTRPKILSIMKVFIEKGNLQLVDEDTLSELLTFVDINGKYQADKSYHDDLVMALAISFAPYLNLNNIEDYNEFLKELEANRIEVEQEETDTMGILGFGFFSDATEAVHNPNKVIYEGFDDYDSLDYDQDIDGIGGW